jgi:hypothetical protein
MQRPVLLTIWKLVIEPAAQRETAALVVEKISGNPDDDNSVAVPDGMTLEMG